MILLAVMSRKIISGYPRVSGGDPVTYIEYIDGYMLSPRERG